MKLLLENIKELVQVEENPVAFCAGADMATVTTIKDAFLIIRDELIQDFGPMSALKDVYRDDDILVEIDCSGRLVYPSYCDSHTHLLYPAPREQEFVDRIRGLSYEEIARELDLPLGTVKAQLFRAREILFNLIGETEMGMEN